MLKTTLAGTALLAALLSPQIAAAIHWSPAPPPHGAQHQHRGAAKSFVLQGGDNATVHLITPQLDARPLPLTAGRASVPSTGSDNYHALVAVQRTGHATDSAVRYIYMHGKPSGHSPSEITAFSKARLEIVPDPLPREHWRYYSGDTIQILLRFNDAPLANHALQLTTGNGSTLSATTDSNGRATFLLPDDFAQIGAGRSENRPAELLITASHTDRGHSFSATLAHDYHVNPSHWQSTTLGIATMVGGILMGVAMLYLSRRKKG